MKTFKIDVSKLDMEQRENLFTGSVDVELENVRDRLKTVKSLDVGDDNIDNADKLLELAAQRIKSVDVKFNGDTSFDSLDDLGFYEEGTALIGAIGRAIVQGIPMGGVLKPQ